MTEQREAVSSVRVSPATPAADRRAFPRATRELVGEDGLAQIWWDIARDETRRDSDRLEASRLLAERGWGKTGTFAPLDSGCAEWRLRSCARPGSRRRARARSSRQPDDDKAGRRVASDAADSSASPIDHSRLAHHERTSNRAREDGLTSPRQPHLQALRRRRGRKRGHPTPEVGLRRAAEGPGEVRRFVAAWRHWRDILRRASAPDRVTVHMIQRGGTRMLRLV